MTYIAGYIGIAFMIIISPLMIPLVLFQRTKEYFDKWVKLLISFSMQPVLMLLFISLTITAVDLALVSGDYSVMYRIAGDASRQSSFNINSYLTEKGAISKEAKLLFFSKTTTNTPKDENISQANSIISNLSTSSDCLEEVASTQSGEGKKCAGNTATQMFRDSINWKKLAEARSPAVVPEADAKPEQQIAREVLAAAIFLGVVVFVMNRLMAVVPHVILDLVGDFGQTPSMNRVATEQWNNAANQASGGLSSSIGQSLKSLTDRRGGAE
jgi:hypothetical protein